MRHSIFGFVAGIIVKRVSAEGTIVSFDEIVGLLDGSAVAGSFVGVVGDIDGYHPC